MSGWKSTSAQETTNEKSLTLLPHLNATLCRPRLHPKSIETRWLEYFALFLIAAVRVMVDRRGTEQPDFGCPFVRLMQLDGETFETDKIPPDLGSIPAMNPGSR
jgi:hypothetical protein